jgi:preprotein translocase subunit SecA
MHIQGMPEEDEQPLMQPVELPPMQAHHVDPFTGEDELAMADAASAAGRSDVRSAGGVRRCRRGRGVAPNRKAAATWGKVARKAPCPCGSGKKYKHCHGKHD